MTDIFADPKLLLAGANEDINELEGQIRAFFDPTPYARVVEHNPKTGFDTHKLKLTKKFPESLSRRAAHIAADLRSTLDQAGFACAKASGNTRLKNTYFPFAPTVADIDRVIRGRCKDLPPEIVTLFRSFNAYRGGDDLLWALNEIANSRKHRIIVPIGQGTGGGMIKNFRCPGRLKSMGFPPRWDTIKNEVILCEVAHDSNTTYNLSISFYVGFGKIDVVGGKPVDRVLNALSSKVSGILSATEAEATRIGLI